eukprot:1840967-Amphidinium_carterae.1
MRTASNEQVTCFKSRQGLYRSSLQQQAASIHLNFESSSSSASSLSLSSSTQDDYNDYLEAKEDIILKLTGESSQAEKLATWRQVERYKQENHAQITQAKVSHADRLIAQIEKRARRCWCKVMSNPRLLYVCLTDFACILVQWCFLGGTGAAAVMQVCLILNWFVHPSCSALCSSPVLSRQYKRRVL